MEAFISSQGHYAGWQLITVILLTGHDRKSYSVPKPHPGANYSNRKQSMMAWEEGFLGWTKISMGSATVPGLSTPFICALVSRTDNIGIFAFIQRCCEWKGTLSWENWYPRNVNWPEVEGWEVQNSIGQQDTPSQWQRWFWGKKRHSLAPL